MTNKRDIYVDVLRGSTMLLVIYAHCGLPFGSIINYFHMPVFFFISGYFFKNEEPKNYITKKIKTLYLPFVIYELIFLLFRNLFLRIGLYTSADWSFMFPITNGKTLLKLITHIFLFDNVDELLAPFWFVTALFFSVIIYYAIYHMCKNKEIRLLFCFGLFIIAFMFTHLNFSVKHSYNFKSIISTTLVATWFIALGHYAKQFDLLSIMKSKICKIPFVECVGVLMLCSVKIFGLNGGMLSNSYNSIIGFFLLSIVGIFTWSLICYRLYLLLENYLPILNKSIEFIGKNSFHFMALQFLAMKPVSLLLLSISNAGGGYWRLWISIWIKFALQIIGIYIVHYYLLPFYVYICLFQEELSSPKKY